MDYYQITFYIFIVLTALYMNYLNDHSTEIIFLYSGNDEETNYLKQILSEMKNVTIVPTIDSETVKNKLNTIKNSFKVAKIEKFSETLDKNTLKKKPKCIMCHPNNMFYQIVNKLNVYGYPFNFEISLPSHSSHPHGEEDNRELDKYLDKTNSILQLSNNI